MTILTALTIQTRGDDIRSQTAQHSKTGKWAGFISLFNGGDFHHHLISTEAIFDSEDAASKAMSDLIAEVRATDLASQPQA